ncbi:MAG: tRNA (adenosine(37)-N6)-threonylcarbamoyltransferase complex dimerization subunit type 1 TsaB [Chlamydiae bacterium RIFCSPHIGHO2_12_FULL_49_11]|nr:MAG: tRNA (adenosine(37)-N6)-threonylcarbamoyltransferase complex dimerization subunit type 1 TsaB [Chlamydiae bacterium RIFCSPHIGHO2_12_FULL_49_11]
MKRLIIDTSSPLSVVHLEADGRVFTVSSEGKSSALLLPQIEELLHAAGIALDDLEEIIAHDGPGSFTGVRTGLLIAQTLAAVKKIPFTSRSLSNETGKSLYKFSNDV